MHATRVAAVAALFLITGVFAAFSHAKLTASVPKDGETVAPGLSQIELTFSKPLRVTLMHVRRPKDNKETPIESGFPKSFANTVKVTVAPLPVGAYEVSWTAVSADGHVMKARFAFSVGKSRSGSPAQ